MNTKFGFTHLSINEFENWLSELRIARTVLYLQQHHTWSPSYIQFKGSNHFEMQKSMRDYHVSENGWADIGQHFTTFPDGSIVTGRSLEKSPACILGFNSNAICMEHVGNFDKGKDTMTPQHRETIISITAALCKKFAIPVNTDKIVYHHWFDLSTGARNNGTKNNKTCPGTNFFGGNSVEDCQQNFLPLVSSSLNGNVISGVTESNVLKYVLVTADSLNIRVEPNAQAKKVADRTPALLGAVLRVFQEKDGWYKISGSQEHWVNASYTKPVKLATVNATTLNVRSGAENNFPKVGSLSKGQEVFIRDQQNGWSKINTDNKWVKTTFLTIR
ncbi:SH3 domain-containing protein [Pedobacter sandarakinus]|uniref:SH3 domain-containing protein n=1 Tax=Pedobacter sandarakinus TaxID=353156 RepID=UPI002246FB84|nr:SH3 domain-containing protein [Pedobacter sandarakinus]MCX2574530.1 N-acetylmuramoyl-L-alanine amidase [Pedobacter sandarakinus]